MPSTRIILKPLGAALILAAFGVVATVALLKNRDTQTVVPTAVVAPVPVASVAAPAASPMHLQNGSMESGGDTPDAWNNIWGDSGKLRVVRDTAKRGGENAALRLESVGDAPVYGSTSQELTGLTPGQTIKVSIAGCAEGKLDEAFIALQVFDPSFKRQIGFDAIANKEHLTGSGGFTTQTREITLPKEPFVARLVVLMKGRGKVWADDIVITATK